MPYCKKCGNRISKFDVDRCPICGEVNPFEGVSSETIEITSEVNEDTDKNFKPRKRQTMLMLFITLGFFGIPFFYLHQKKIAIIFMLINIVGISAISFIFSFYLQILVPFAILIALGIFLLINTASGLYMYFMPNLKDGRGEFVI